MWPLPLGWRCVGVDRWQGRCIVIERHRLTGRYRQRVADLPAVSETFRGED